MGMYGSRGGLKTSMPMRKEHIDRRAVRLRVGQLRGTPGELSGTERNLEAPREPRKDRPEASHNGAEWQLPSTAKP